MGKLLHSRWTPAYRGTEDVKEFEKFCNDTGNVR